MFTGIITHIGTITEWHKVDGYDTHCIIQTDMDLSASAIGASICCAGICLTVTEVNHALGQFTVFLSDETLKKSTAKSWVIGRKVNLERSLRLGDELGGHLVYGHVDDVAQIVKWKHREGSIQTVFATAKQWQSFIAPKGSVTIDGVSLTVNAVDDSQSKQVLFDINLIPHTIDQTTFTNNKTGDFVNLEIDPLARYIQRSLSPSN